MPHIIERAPSGRAKCRACGEKIANGELRLGERLPNTYGEGETEMTHWYHVACAAYRRPAAFLEAVSATSEMISDRDVLEREAQLGVAHERLPRANAAERAPTGRATCRQCREPIDKGAWRISLLYYEDGRFVPSGFVHVPCAAAYCETTDLMSRVRRFSPGLSESELGEIAAAI